jgi:hypothetical protein
MYRRTWPWWIRFVVLSFFVLGLVSCGSDSKKKNPVDDGDDDDITGIWSESDLSTLDTAETRLDALTATSTTEQARAALVAELKTKAGVDSVTLFEDGYTIMVKFDDGMYGAVNTLDYDALNESVSSYSGPSALKQTFSEKTAHTASVSADVVFTEIPSTKKILFLNISQPDLPKNSIAIQWVERSFLNAGWNADDIVVKTRDSKTSIGILPEDVFDVEDYGIVFIFAQGMYGSFREGDPSRYYLQLGSKNVFGKEYENQLRQFVLTGQLVVCDGDFYMRTDLLQYNLDLSDRSMVFLIGSYGTDASGTYLNKTNGHFFGWNGVPQPIDSYNALTSLVGLMASSKPSMSDLEAYTDGSVEKTSENPEGGTAAFNMIPAHGDMYLPAWAVLRIDGATGPSMAASYTAGLQVKNKTVMSKDFAGMSGTVDLISPGAANCFARALKGDGNLLLAATVQDTIVAGENIVDIKFLKELAPGGAKRVDYPNGNQFYPMTADLYSYFIWKKIESLRNYVILNPEGQKFEVVQPGGGSLYLRGDYCFDRQQIESIFGSNFFGMQDDELVWASSGTWAYNPSDTEDVQELEEYWADYLNRLTHLTYEVFPD